MKRTLVLAIAALVAFGLLMPAATADVNGTGVFEGTADVGRHFLTAEGGETDCTKDAKDVFARGQGLYAPPPVGPVPKNGVWSFHNVFTAVGTNHNGDPGLITGRLDACGWLTHTLDDQLLKVGPACTVSKGHSGRGQANFNGGGGINLFDIMWKTSAGPYIPITAKYQVWNGVKPPAGTKQKKNKWGNVIAMVFVAPGQGGVECLEAKTCPNQKTSPAGTPGCGAQTFTVVGQFELVQAPDRNLDNKHGKNEVFRPKDLPDGDEDYQDGPLCKDAGGDLGPCLYDPKKGNGKETPPTSKTE